MVSNRFERGVEIRVRLQTLVTNARLSGPTPGTEAAMRGGVVDLPEPQRKVEYGYLSH